MTPWQPIATAPRDELVLVYLDWLNKVRIARLSTKSRGPMALQWRVYSDEIPYLLHREPTHWMPLPDPPVQP